MKSISAKFLRILKSRSLNNCLSNSAGRSPAFCVLCLMSILDEFLFNPQVRILSRTVPGTSHDNDLENREPTGDRSQSDSRHEVEFSVCRTSNSINFDPKETSHSDVFRIFLKNFIKLGGVLFFAFKIWQTKIKQSFASFGCSLINFTSHRQPYNFVAHYNKSNTD